MTCKYDPITYRHPRTLEEAFGPYERWGQIVDPEEDYPEMTLSEAIMTYFGGVFLGALILIALSGLFV